MGCGAGSMDKQFPTFERTAMACGAVSVGKQFPRSERTAVPQNVRTIHPVTRCYSPDGSGLQ
jgi:hypothetical protein